MKVCALLHKAHRWDTTILDAQKVLDLATIDGATALGVAHEIGSLEVGKRADLILLDASAPDLHPIHGRGTVVSDLVYSASSGNVDTTIVDGNVLMKGRKVRSLNMSHVCSRAQDLATRLVK